ncbi:hypothetical protein K503DRAFT_844628, partial [Rhizopogon vinicolor AM-OR11-026]
KCREIINTCQHSGQRRRLQAIIEAGNANGYWSGKLPDGEDKIPVLRLLRDCPMRWSSTFRMIDLTSSVQTFTYALHLKAIQSFLQGIQNSDIAPLSMDSKDLDVLRDIHQIIEVSHAAQEHLAAERTPTLSVALPSYELLENKWSKLKQTIWGLSHNIGFGLDKLTEYIHEGRKTRIYALTMSKSSHTSTINKNSDIMKVHWNKNDTIQAREWMLDAVCVSFVPSFRVPDLVWIADGILPCIDSFATEFTAACSVTTVLAVQKWSHIYSRSL